MSGVLLLLTLVCVGLALGYGWALLEAVLGSWVGWAVVAGTVLAAVLLTHGPAR